MCVSQDRDFGKEIGLIHEMIVRGRKAGADRDFYKALAENEDLFKEVVGFTKKEVWQPVISQTLKLEVNRTKPLTELFNDLLEQLKPVVLSKEVPGLVKIYEKEFEQPQQAENVDTCLIYYRIPMEIGKIFDQICARKWRLLNLREYLCYLAARMWPPSDRFSMASIIFFEAWMKDEKPAFLSEGLEFEIFVDDVTLTDWPTGILLDRGHLSAKRCHLLITPVTETAA